jgi:hypothetical protein
MTNDCHMKPNFHIFSYFFYVFYASNQIMLAQNLKQYAELKKFQ